MLKMMGRGDSLTKEQAHKAADADFLGDGGMVGKQGNGGKTWKYRKDGKGGKSGKRGNMQIIFINS